MQYSNPLVEPTIYFDLDLACPLPVRLQLAGVSGILRFAGAAIKMPASDSSRRLDM